MKRIQAVAVVGILTFCAGVQAQEWRRDGVAKCPPAKPTGELTIARLALQAGDARHWLSVDPAFAAKHAAEARGEAPWLRSFIAKSGPVRVYSSGSRLAFVVAVCPAQDCAGQRAWVAFEPVTGSYGITVMEGRNVREVIPGAHNTTLAEHAPLIGDALQCAIQADS